MTVRLFFASRAENGRAVIRYSFRGEPQEWITRVDGEYIRCHAEAETIRAVDPEWDLAHVQALPMRDQKCLTRM